MSAAIMQSCPQCENTIENSFKFCPNCGTYLNKNMLEAQLMQAMDYQRQGKSWEAMQKFKELTENYSQYAHFHKLLGNTYFHMGLLDWAVDSYRKAISIDSNYIDAHYDLGISLYHRAKVNEAITEFQTVLKLDPDYHSAHYRIGLCYHHAGKLNAAIHHLFESTVVTPEYVMAHYHLGVIYYKMGDFKKAENAFRRVLEEDPQNSASDKYLNLIAEQLQHKNGGRIFDKVKKEHKS